MTVLGIDYWEKRIGLAIEVEKIAMPFDIIERHKIIKELKKIILEKKITEIVMWEPSKMKWENQKILEKVHKFKEKLENIFPKINISLIDERFTTSIIDNSFWKRDDLSAVLILETYLTRKKRKQK